MDGKRRAHGRLMLAATVLGLAACASSGGASSSSTAAGATSSAGGPSLAPLWKTNGAPIARSIFLRNGSVITAGERVEGSQQSELIAVFDATSGKLRWTHPLRQTGSDPQAVGFQSEHLRIVAAADGVFLSSYAGVVAEDPIVGYAVQTGLRLFPIDAKIDSLRTKEELVGSSDLGLVSNSGVLRSPATGVIGRLKGVPGEVLGVSGTIAIAWSPVDSKVIGYELSTDNPVWKLSRIDRPNLVVLDDHRVVVAGDDGWQLVDSATGTATTLDATGKVDPLNSFDTCDTSSYQSVPVGRFTTPIICDGRFVATPRSGRLRILDVTTNKSADVAACDTQTDPYAISDGILVCATAIPGGAARIKLLDAVTGKLLLTAPNTGSSAPAGVAFSGGQLVVAFHDGTLQSFRVSR